MRWCDAKAMSDITAASANIRLDTISALVERLKNRIRNCVCKSSAWVDDSECSVCHDDRAAIRKAKGG